ncbi:hypothetical protein NDS46_04870 [Paenibacillus thiaminolyticus]|uniref:RHS repeat-associated core domain-containing protein n=1 Tax=Paenibacillus thiaminolyticus TaxID=49283 RepID=UPI00232B8D5C|nr:RHS repeat-associated core domain-containing protein [Paenibacillus thiaminolyticus]WCF09239.1 hypothetical protein NDS46_04870 [Paenibacillus thiaminolyticus]
MPDGSYVRHEYDPEGLRSGICENGVTSRFVFDGWNMLNELDKEWNAKASYVRGHELLAQVDGQGDAYYYLNNQHGDVVHITNRLGGIVNSYEYDAFGHTLSATEGIPNRFRYAGEQFDPVTQQYYLRARFYNPLIARFTQEDEYRGDGLNLYAYVGNNPIRYVDPSGYSCEEKGNVYGKGDKKEGPYAGTGKTRAEYLREKYGKLSSEQLHANINNRAEISFPQRSTKSQLKQGGYSTNDVDAYKKMSPNKNRAPGFGTSKLDGLVQAHHAIQDEWAKLWAKRNGIKYSSSNAPSLLLKSISGESHAIISALQRARRRTEGFNTSIVYEFNESYREMIKAGVNPKVAQKVIGEAYRFFDGLGGFK